MLRIGLAMMAILFFLSGSLIAQRVQSEDTHYYLYEYTDEDGNNVAIIIEVNSENPTSPGSEFTEVTSDELHSKGYRTPSESENSADVIDRGEGPESGYNYSSWIKKGFRQNNTIKWVECGSSTSRSWYVPPGPLFVACTTYRRIAVPPYPGGPVFIREYSTWGYYTKLTYYQEYRAGNSFFWWQHGRHHWGDPQNMKYSRAGTIH